MPNQDIGASQDQGCRLYKPTLADLIDRLTVDQIKEVLLPKSRESYAEEIKRLEHDIDAIIKAKGLEFSASLVRITIVLAQMNLHIWHCKDRMQEDSDHYSDWLKLAHQLNGIRNRMKNLLMKEAGDGQPSVQHTNVDTDGLQGWDVSI